MYGPDILPQSHVRFSAVKFVSVPAYWSVIKKAPSLDTQCHPDPIS